MNRRRARALIAGLALSLVVAIVPAFGGGPRSVNGSGQPMAWDTTGPVVYNPDQGSLGTLGNAAARSLVTSAFDVWDAAAGPLRFSEGALLPYDITAAGIPATNPAHYLNFFRKSGDGLSPVIFDADGSIIDDLFGPGARFEIIGVGALDTPISATDTRIHEASIIINGAFFDGLGLPGSPTDLPSQTAFKAAIVHEIGHFLNLDHTVLNRELVGDGNTANDIYVPTMYPLLADDEAALADLNPDDVAAVKMLYETGPATVGISGAVATRDTEGGIVWFQGAQVVLRKVDDPYGTAYSAISGALFYPCNPGGVCYPNCDTTPCDSGNPMAKGSYSVNWMAPGSYKICVRQIDTRFSAATGSAIGPLSPPPILPGPEECYDEGESFDPSNDDPDYVLPVNVSSLQGPFDIWLNGLPVADPFEPNNSLAAAATLADLSSGEDTVGAVLAVGDLDFYAIPVVRGQRIHIDVDAAELGSTLDAVIGLYDASGALIASSDDAVDPDSGAFSLDPALDVTASLTGTAKVVVSSSPDLDLNGTGGTTTGPYWLRVRVRSGDADGDGVADYLDNCPSAANPGQEDLDGDGLGNACDEDDDGDGLSDAAESITGSNPLDADSDDDGVGDGAEVAAGTNPNDSASASNLFGSQTVISVAADGAESIFAADVDGDGDIDVLSASFNDDKIAWYENDASPPTWPSRTISLAADGALEVFATDVDGDGDMDVLSASLWDDKIAWYENNGASPPVWTARTISTTASGARSVFAADVDGDGDIDVLSASSSDDKIAWYENNGGSPPAWTERTISLLADSAFSVFAADVDGDGDIDVLSASYVDNKIAWYENNGASPPAWTARTISTAANGAFVVSSADVDGDGDTDVLSASYDDDKIAWYENNGASPPAWTARTISTAADGAASVLAADVDGDGDTDVLSASGKDDKIAWYENNGASPPVWTARTISTAADGALSVFAADVDGDGDTDVLSASQNDDKVAWYENRTIHRSVAFPQQSTISTGSNQAFCVFAADVDGDGDTDVLDATFGLDRIAWYENNGASPPAFTAHTISTTADGADSVVAADIDGDGDIDVLSASFNDDKIAWYENNGASPPAFTARTISTAADGADSVVAADVDGDGDSDVLSASYFDHKVAWYENVDGAGTFGPQRVISTLLDYAQSIFAADIDGDGDTDVVAGSWLTSGSIVWYENLDGAGTFGLQRVILTPAEGVLSVFAADVDGDGDTDVLDASYGLDKIGWYENLNGAGTFGPRHLISTLADFASGVFATDLDRDGDMDVLSASANDNKIAWYENNGGSSPGWTPHTISLGVVGARSVFAADVDGDGDKDVLSASSIDGKIAWYPNRGGHLAFSTLDIAPATIGDGQSAALLRISAMYLGRGGESAVALSTLGLIFEEAPGDRLTGPEANDLIENLYVYLDTGSGSFEAGSDTLVATVASLSDLPHAILFDPTDPNVRLGSEFPPGRKYFVVVQTRAGASSRTPNRFRVVLDVAKSAAWQTLNGRAAALEYAPNVASRIVRAGPPDLTPPLVTGVLPPNLSIDVALSSHVLLLMSEAVDPATATPIAIGLSVGGVKVPGSIGVSADGLIVSFAPEAPLALNTDYVVSVTSSLRDLAGNAAVPFTSTFDTVNDATSGTLQPDQIGDPGPDEGAGSVIPGQNANDHSGFASAALGDVNGDGIADLAIGAPNADVGTIVDAGNVTLVFGRPGLQSNAGAGPTLVYRDSAGSTGDGIGTTVSRAGDLGGPDGLLDGLADMVIGAPYADANGVDSGVVYIVFGNVGLDELAPATLDLSSLAACTPPRTHCGVKIVGQAPGDLAGTSAGYAGDINKDGKSDLVIGAPGADPAGRSDAGKVYLIYGPFWPGTLDLAGVGSVLNGAARAGLVFQGEGAGDRAGQAVSCWPDSPVDQTDDLLIGAPEASVNDEFGTTMTQAGLVYAIHGGVSNLNDTATPGVIDLSRLANGETNQVAGTVFMGSRSEHHIGRSVTGAADVNGDGEDDVIIGAHDEAWVIPGNGPKGTTIGTPTGGPRITLDLLTLRTGGESNVVAVFGGVPYVAGVDGDIGDLTVGPAGDINNDGIGDFVIGGPLADPGGRVDAGKAYVVYGNAIVETEADVPLPEIGKTKPGLTVEGRQAGDQLGSSVGGGFDLNADGVSDGLVGAPFADSGGETDAGETYVISPIAPSEVIRLLMSKSMGTTVLEWTVAHRARAYNVYRGRLSRIRAAGLVRTSDMCDTAGLCQLACGINTDADLDQLPDTTDAALPPANDAYVYLVTGINLDGEGPIEPAGALPQRVNDAQCP